MAGMSWLQCQVPKDEWKKLNEQRLRLGLKWVDILLQATLEYLDRLGANPQSPELTAEQAKK